MSAHLSEKRPDNSGREASNGSSHIHHLFTAAYVLDTSHRTVIGGKPYQRKLVCVSTTPMASAEESSLNVVVLP